MPLLVWKTALGKKRELKLAGSLIIGTGDTVSQYITYIHAGFIITRRQQTQIPFKHQTRIRLWHQFDDKRVKNKQNPYIMAQQKHLTKERF